MEIIVTQRGKEMLAYDGYLYQNKRTNKKNSSTWECCCALNFILFQFIHLIAPISMLL